MCKTRMEDGGLVNEGRKRHFAYINRLLDVSQSGWLRYTVTLCRVVLGLFVLTP